MQNLTIISELIRQQNRGTLDLYSKIPYKLRKHLDQDISHISWDIVNEGCEQRDENSLDHANKLYQFVLDKADEYIRMHSQNRDSDSSTEMMVDKFSIKNEFKDDAARFVSEMAKCLKKEKELIFTYHEAGNMDSQTTDHPEDITDQMEDGDLKTIEELIQEADNQLYQAINHIEEEEKYMDISLRIYESLQQGDSSVEADQKIADRDQYRNCAAEFKSLDMSGERVKMEGFNCKQKALDALMTACHLSSLYVEKLSRDLKTWKTAETLWSVEVVPEPDTGSLINKYKRFGDVINKVMSWFSNTGNLQVIRQKEQEKSPNQMDIFSVAVGNLELEFKKIMSIIQVIVVTQPKGVISIENKGKKDSPNYCTKKTQPFTTAVRILASECFQSFHVKSAEVELVAEKDLAQKLNVPVTGRNRHSCLNVETTAANTRPDIQFNIEVKNFSRFEQNNVYKQFFRLRYKLTVSINDIDYNLETMSLPFTFNTGANQILEHKGSRFWYLMSAKDLYNGDFICPDPLPAEDVICMLDSRVACLGKKARRLTESEKLFLKGRLPVSSDGTVTMQGFLKDKMRTLRTDEPLSFSFYTWFYAVIHSIELLLLEAWQDGIIYGFCSDKHAEELLMVKTVPEGTFLLRPSVSIVNKTSSIEATSALVMEVKMRNEDAHPFDSPNCEFSITSLPLYYDHIEENTLFDAINGIVLSNDTPVAKFLYGRDGGRKLDVLKGYVKKPEQKFIPEYLVMLEKMKKLKFRKCSCPGSDSVKASDEDESEREPTKRKRRYRKSSSNTQSQVPSVLSTIDDSSRGSPSMQLFSEFSPEDINQNTPSLQFPSNVAVQCPRSGTQGKKMPGTSDQKANSESMEQKDNVLILSGQVQTFGDLQIDVSQISTVFAGNPSMYDQIAHTSPVAVLNECENAASPDHNRGTPHIFAAQYPNSGINCFGESSRSPTCNVGYNVSVSSSPTPTGQSSEQSPSNSNSFQCRGQSPLQPHVQAMVNLPTILNEARESNRNQRRRGNGRGNSSRTRGREPSIHVSPVSEPQVWEQNMNDGTQPQLQFIQNGIPQNQILSADMNISYDIINSNSFSFSMDESISQYNYNEIDLDNVDDQQLLMCLREQPLCN